jgi:antitoxin YobK
MTMADLEAALNLVGASTLAAFHGPQPEARVQSAEKALGTTLPPTYRRFVRELGAGFCGGLELFGITGEPGQTDSAHDTVHRTLEERTYGLPPDMIIVAETGMGEFYVLDLAQSDEQGEGPVVIVPFPSPDLPSSESEHVAVDFGAFLLDRIVTWNENHPSDPA